MNGCAHIIYLFYDSTVQTIQVLYAMHPHNTASRVAINNTRFSNALNVALCPLLVISILIGVDMIWNSTGPSKKLAKL